MSDAEQRERARRFRTSGAAADEAAWLAALARQGGEPALRIELAAGFDHPPAVTALAGRSGGWSALRRLVLPAPAPAPGETPLPRLTLATAAGEHLTMGPPSEPVVVGRDPSCALRLGGIMALSRRHARVRYEAGRGFLIEDLGSSSGLYINGLRADVQVLRAGDRVQAGGSHLWVLALEELDAAAHAALARDRQEAEAWLETPGLAPELLRALKERAAALLPARGPAQGRPSFGRPFGHRPPEPPLVAALLLAVSRVGLPAARDGLVPWLLQTAPGREGA